MKAFIVSLLCALALVSADESNGLCKDVTGRKFIADPKDCQWYYSCVDGVGSHYQCVNNLFFNEQDQYCSEDDSHCDGDVTPDVCPGGDGPHFVPIAGHCNKYIMCIAGNPFEQECAEGLWYDEEAEKCDFEATVDCNSCPFVDDPLNPTFLPNKKDCNGYYICFKRNRVAFSCGDGLHFSEKINKCTDPKTAKCKYVTPTEAPTTPEPTTEPTSSTETTTTESTTVSVESTMATPP